MHLDEFGLVPPIGFMIDTTLAFARMILSGFIDQYPNLKLIAAHGGATLPYLAGRLDRCHEMIPACSSVIKDKPSEYLKRIWYDTVVYDQRALEMCIAVAGSPDRVLYGSDYPHNIGDMEGCLARVDALPGAQAKRVRGAAARELFGLDFPISQHCLASLRVHPLGAEGKAEYAATPLLDLREHLLRDPHRIEHRGRAGIDADLHEDLADLVLGDAVGTRRGLAAQLVRA